MNDTDAMTTAMQDVLLLDACRRLVRELRMMAHAEGLYAPFAVYSDDVKAMWINAARVIENEVIGRNAERPARH